MFHYINTFIMFKHVKFGKHIWKHTSKHAHFKISSRDEMFTRLFFFFFIPGWNFMPVFLTWMSSSQDEISSRQKRVNSKRHFTIDRDDFVPWWNFTCKHPLNLSMFTEKNGTNINNEDRKEFLNKKKCKNSLNFVTFKEQKNQYF